MSSSVNTLQEEASVESFFNVVETETLALFEHLEFDFLEEFDVFTPSRRRRTRDHHPPELFRAFLHCYYKDIYGTRPVTRELQNTVVWLSCGFDRPRLSTAVDRFLTDLEHVVDEVFDRHVEQAETLKDVGYSADDIVHISKNANSKYPVRIQRPIEGSVRNPLDGYRAQKPAGTGATTEQLVKLRKQDIPADDIKYYVENGYRLEFVSYLKKSRSPQEVKGLVEDLRRTKFAVFLFGKCRDISASNKAGDRTIKIGDQSFKPPQKCGA